jgi:hypothetical protein
MDNPLARPVVVAWGSRACGHSWWIRSCFHPHPTQLHSLDIGRDRCDAFAACCDSLFRGCELLPRGPPKTTRQILLLKIPPLPFILALSSTILFWEYELISTVTFLWWGSCFCFLQQKQQTCWSWSGNLFPLCLLSYASPGTNLEKAVKWGSHWMVAVCNCQGSIATCGLCTKHVRGEQGEDFV